MSASDLSETQLRDAKLRALAEFAAGAGHEINNPVATIIGYAQQLLAKETDPERRQALLTIGAQAYRIRDMIGDAMLFARPPEPRPTHEDLAQACREVVATLQADLPGSISWEVKAEKAVTIWADAVQLRIVISSLLKNSVEAVSGSAAGRIGVEVDAQEIDGRAWGRLRMSDNGRGLSELEREHLFDPFFSGRQAGRGLGFGLPKCWRIVTLHGGRIEVTSLADQTTATVLWPSIKDENSARH